MEKIQQLFEDGGKFTEHILASQQATHWTDLQAYVSSMRSCLWGTERLQKTSLNIFQPIRSISENYRIPAGEDGYWMVTSFIKRLIGMDQKEKLEDYMNESDVNYTWIHYILRDPIIKEFFESLPVEDWYDRKD